MLYRPIKWFREPGKEGRRILALFCAIVLSATVIGLTIVIPGIIEWNRQAKQLKEDPSRGATPNPVATPQMPTVNIKKRQMLAEAIEKFKKGEPVSKEAEPYFKNRQSQLNTFAKISKTFGDIGDFTDQVTDKFLDLMGEDNHSFDSFSFRELSIDYNNLKMNFKEIEDYIKLIQSPATMLDCFLEDEKHSRTFENSREQFEQIASKFDTWTADAADRFAQARKTHA